MFAVKLSTNEAAMVKAMVNDAVANRLTSVGFTATLTKTNTNERFDTEVAPLGTSDVYVTSDVKPGPGNTAVDEDGRLYKELVAGREYTRIVYLALLDGYKARVQGSLWFIKFMGHDGDTEETLIIRGDRELVQKTAQALGFKSGSSNTDRALDI